MRRQQRIELGDGVGVSPGDRDEAIELRIVSLIDATEAALTEQFFELEAPQESLARALVEFASSQIGRVR